MLLVNGSVWFVAGGGSEDGGERVLGEVFIEVGCLAAVCLLACVHPGVYHLGYWLRKLSWDESQVPTCLI